MSRKRSYVEAMENGEIEQFYNQNSNNVPRTESTSELNFNDSANEVFVENNGEIYSIVYLDEESLSNESYVESVNEHLQETIIPDRHPYEEKDSDGDCEENIDRCSKFKQDLDCHSDEIDNPECEDLRTRENDSVNLHLSENSLTIQNMENYSQQCEMGSVNNFGGSSTSDNPNDDQSLKFRLKIYPVSSERLHIFEKEHIDQQIDNKFDILNSVEEYVVSSTNERFSSDFVNNSQFSNAVSSEPNYAIGNDLMRYEPNNVEQDIEDNTNTNSSSFQNNTTSGELQRFPIHYTGRNSSRKRKRNPPQHNGFRMRKWKRLIYKNGEVNIPSRKKLKNRAEKYMKDLVTTLIDGQWRWVIFLLSACHFAIWIGFALLYYVASYANGDMSDNPPAIPCITEGRTFTGIFTFSVETQVSIGYGEKSPTDACPEVIFIVVMEVVAGYILLGAMVGIVYTKIVRPEKHLKGVGFSKNAVVCLRNGQLCLVVRVWDHKQKHVMSTRISGWFVKHTAKGPVNIPLKFSPGVMILWPVTLQHTIDKYSPLFDMSAKDLLDREFEIIIAVIGGCRLTGNVTQSRTSYLPINVQWGHRFVNVLRYSATQQSYIAEIRLLDTVEKVDTPLCSARLLDLVNSSFSNRSPKDSISPVYLTPPGSPLCSPLSTYTAPISRSQDNLIIERNL